tara:strand:+ start:318 stop:1037 length:720 start_codon:yes stop_codon:yes gene_type:complete
MHKTLSFKDVEGLNLLVSVIKDEINKFTSKSINNLSLLHEFVDQNSINSCRLNAFNTLNKFEWLPIITKGTLQDVSSLIGPDLLIQKKLNLSIQLPGDQSSVLKAHTDCNSGDSPFQLNIWIPLTRAYGSNSMFLIDKRRSIEYYRDLSNGTLKEVLPTKEDYLEVAFGDYILFPPTLIHGNTINTTNKTRISLNIRCKSVFSPYQKNIVPDRTYGSYYEKWNLSEIFLWNNSIYQIMS